MKEIREAFDEFWRQLDDYWTVWGDKGLPLESRTSAWGKVKLAIGKFAELVNQAQANGPIEVPHLADLRKEAEDLQRDVNACDVSGPDRGHRLLDALYNPYPQGPTFHKLSSHMERVREAVLSEITNIENNRKQNA